MQMLPMLIPCLLIICEFPVQALCNSTKQNTKAVGSRSVAFNLFSHYLQNIVLCTLLQELHVSTITVAAVLIGKKSVSCSIKRYAYS